MRRYFKIKIPNFKIRFATEEDTKLIITFIKELADYEKLLSEVVATEEILYNSLFIKKAGRSNNRRI